MAHKITVKYLKNENDYIQAYKKSKKVKRLRAYVRALVLNEQIIEQEDNVYISLGTLIYCVQSIYQVH